jgi:hypothetical protein
MLYGCQKIYFYSLEKGNNMAKDFLIVLLLIAALDCKKINLVLKNASL